MLTKSFPSFSWLLDSPAIFFSFPLRGVQRTVSRNTSVLSSAELPAKFLSESILHYRLSRPVMCSRVPFLNTMTTPRSFSTTVCGGEAGCTCMHVYVSVWKSMPRGWREQVSHDAPSGLKGKEIQDAHLELLY